VDETGGYTLGLAGNRTGVTELGLLQNYCEPS